MIEEFEKTKNLPSGEQISQMSLEELKLLQMRMEDERDNILFQIDIHEATVPVPAPDQREWKAKATFALRRRQTLLGQVARCIKPIERKENVIDMIFENITEEEWEYIEECYSTWRGDQAIDKLYGKILRLRKEL